MKTEAVTKKEKGLFTSMNEIFAEMERMHREISERAFELFKKRGGGLGSDWDDWFKAESEINKAVPFDVTDKEGEILVKAELPGFKPEEIKVSVDGKTLTVTGRSEVTEEKEKGEKFTSSKQFVRQIVLSSDVDTEKAAATFKEGVLELVLPKLAAKSEIKVDAK